MVREKGVRQVPEDEAAIVSDFYPIASLVTIDLGCANACLSEWGHKMGPIVRGNNAREICHALTHEDRPIAIATSSPLIREKVGGCEGFTRENTIELSRLCAARPGLCRVMLRLWREFIFPTLGKEFAISYQDAALHSGNLYRFDGWQRIAYSRSGTDSRSGRNGRNKWVWVWPVSTGKKGAA